MSCFVQKCRSLCFFTILLTIPALVGCGDSGPPTGNLSGTVSNGEELVGDCVVSLYDPVSKRAMGGKVNDQGEFKIKEMPLGTYNIGVMQRTTGEAVNEPFDERIPQKYRDQKTSGFSVTIKEGENSTELKMAP